MPNAPEIALLGGGTGSFTLLSELKDFTPHITAIPNMCDDGGSTGKLRDELGVLPPGDVLQCIVALCSDPELQRLYRHRFSKGSMDGDTLGNLALAGGEEVEGSFDKAVKILSRMLSITGKVTPVSLDNHKLVMTDGDEIIEGESIIGHRQINNADARLSLSPPATINPEAEEAIAKADLVVIAPGNLYGSILPIFSVAGVPEAIQNTKAKKISITNLVTKPGQTDGWHVADYVKQIERYIGEGQIDMVLYNNGQIDPDLFQKYAYDNEFPVDFSGERFGEVTARAIGADVISREITMPDPKDKAVPRTYIRHDARQVGRKLMQIFYED